MNDREQLNSLQTEYQMLKALDRDSDAARRYELRDEVGQLSHLMGPAEQSAWIDALNGPHETAAEYEAEAAAERLLGEAAIEGLARDEWVSDGEQSFMPPDWQQRVEERRREIRAEPVDVDKAVAAAEAAAETLAEHHATKQASEAEAVAGSQTHRDQNHDRTLS